MTLFPGSGKIHHRRRSPLNRSEQVAHPRLDWVAAVAWRAAQVASLALLAQHMVAPAVAQAVRAVAMAAAVAMVAAVAMAAAVAIAAAARAAAMAVAAAVAGAAMPAATEADTPTAAATAAADTDMADLDTAAAAASSVAVGRSTLAAATAPVQEATAGCRARRTAAAATCRAIAVAVAVPAFTARASRAEATARRRQALWAALELWAARGSSSSRSSHPTSTAVAWERHLRLGVVLPHCLRVGGTVESTSPLLMSGHMSYNFYYEYMIVHVP